MKMPTSPVLFCIHPDGKVFADLEGGWREYKAIPVPPHGRAIDADALISQYKGNILTAQTDYAEGLRDAIADIKTAPTIVEAEEEKE
jgi:hypothetical protein